MKTRFYFTSADNAKQAESIMYYALAEAQIGAMALTWVSDDDDMSVDVKIDDPRWKKAVTTVIKTALDKRNFSYGYGDVGEVTRVSGVTVDELDEAEKLLRASRLKLVSAKKRWFTIGFTTRDEYRQVLKLCKDMHLKYDYYTDCLNKEYSLDIYCTRNDVDTINEWVERNLL